MYLCITWAFGVLCCCLLRLHAFSVIFLLGCFQCIPDGWMGGGGHTVSWGLENEKIVKVGHLRSDRVEVGSCWFLVIIDQTEIMSRLFDCDHV